MASVLIPILSLLVATARAGDDSGGSDHRSPVRGPIFDITHFDVTPLD
jgi:hypothetical protein